MINLASITHINPTTRHHSAPSVTSLTPAAFLQSNPRLFLQNNLLIFGGGIADLPSTAGTHHFTLEPAPHLHGQNLEGQEIPCYFVKACSQRTPNSFKAHFLPFREGAISKMDLDDNAELFFTSPLTGCGFGFTQSNPPQVSHMDGEAFSDESMQRDSPNASIYTQSQYDNAQYYTSAQIIGVKESDGWSFISQPWIMTGMEKYQLELSKGFQELGHSSDTCK